MNGTRSYLIAFLLLTSYKSFAQHALSGILPVAAERKDELVRKYLSPTRILWQTTNAASNIQHAEKLLKPGNGQADLSGKDICILQNNAEGSAGILLDFGKEIHGGLQIVTDRSRDGKPVKLRLRFGESVSEAMSEIDTAGGATNDHAMRDFEISVPWLGKIEVGNTGFRFVRIDVLERNAEVKIKEISAILVSRNLSYLGSFTCSDSLLNKIWLTGAYTVELNMQDYLWDGIKRDRLVWVGDMHPEVATIAAVFGSNEVVTKSLDLAKNITPLPEYMNGMISYSMWWVIIQRDWYMHNANLSYLKQQQLYLTSLLDHFLTKIDSYNNEHLDDGVRFLDWPSSTDSAAIHAGLQAMLVMALEAGAQLEIILQNTSMADKCYAAIAKLKQQVPDPGASKQAAALLALSGLMPAEKANRVLSANGVHNYSTFFGYYMLLAKAKAGDYQGSLDAIRNYWGPMLALGATTFWEDFNIDWLQNAGRIDELVPAGKKDIHRECGAFCYKGLRQSLSHGWASGPTPWLTQFVLGVNVMAPGCKVIKIEPHLGDLMYAEGSYPTPLGIVHIKNIRLPGGKVKIEVHAPKGIKIIKVS